MKHISFSVLNSQPNGTIRIDDSIKYLMTSKDHISFMIRAKLHKKNKCNSKSEEILHIERNDQFKLV